MAQPPVECTAFWLPRLLCFSCVACQCVLCAGKGVLPHLLTCLPQPSGTLAAQVLFEGEMDLMSTPEDSAEQRRRLNPDTFVMEVVYEQVG